MITLLFGREEDTTVALLSNDIRKKSSEEQSFNNCKPKDEAYVARATDKTCRRDLSKVECNHCTLKGHTMRFVRSCMKN